MIIIDEPNVPHKKKKESDTSKANKKSKHKHIYDKKAIFEYQGNGALDSIWYIGIYYCSICGKIGRQIDTSFLQNYKKTREEWLEKHPDATFIKLERGRSWFNINNINEVK